VSGAEIGVTSPGSPGQLQSLSQLLSQHALSSDVAGVHLTTATLECLARCIEAETIKRCTCSMATRQMNQTGKIGENVTMDEGLDKIFKTEDSKLFVKGIPTEFKLNFCGRVGMTAVTGALKVCTFHDVDFYMDCGGLGNLQKDLCGAERD
jgi:hypothetical protein